MTILLKAGKEIDDLMIVKILSTLPLIILDWFLIKQYNDLKKLIKEYAFKSAVALSIMPYYELIKAEKENDDTLSFINKAVDNIYSHPIEKRNSDNYKFDKNFYKRWNL